MSDFVALSSSRWPRRPPPHHCCGLSRQQPMHATFDCSEVADRLVTATERIEAVKPEQGRH